MAETDDSVVGVSRHGVTVPAPNLVGGANQRRSECDDYTKSPKSRAGEPGLPGENLIFDAEKLHSQLADLLQLYLKRAADPDAIEQCSAKDALACAKTLTQMMSDLQSGKPASVKTWVRPPIQADDHRSRRLDRRRYPSGGSPRPTSYVPPSTRSNAILKDSLTVVLSTDQESHLEEPYQRFLARMDRLCDEVCDRLDISSVGAQHAVLVAEHDGRADTPKSRASQPGLLRGDATSSIRTPSPPTSNPFPPTENSRQNTRCENNSPLSPDTANRKKRRRRSLYTMACGNGRGAARAPT